MVFYSCKGQNFDFLKSHQIILRKIIGFILVKMENFIINIKIVFLNVFIIFYIQYKINIQIYKGIQEKLDKIGLNFHSIDQELILISTFNNQSTIQNILKPRFGAITIGKLESSMHFLNGTLHERMFPIILRNLTTK